MGGRVLRALCAVFCLHYYHYRYRRLLKVFRCGNDIYRFRYRYRSYFGLIVPKPFWFRYPTLITVTFVHFHRGRKIFAVSFAIIWTSPGHRLRPFFPYVPSLLNIMFIRTKTSTARRCSTDVRIRWSRSRGFRDIVFQDRKHA